MPTSADGVHIGYHARQIEHVATTNHLCQLFADHEAGRLCLAGDRRIRRGFPPAYQTIARSEPHEHPLGGDLLLVKSSGATDEAGGNSCRGGVGLGVPNA